MGHQPLVHPITGKRPVSQANRGPWIKMLCVIRDQFSISAWLCIGASLQIAISSFSSRKVIVFAPLLLLLFRFVNTMLMTLGFVRNSQAEGSIHSTKYTAQIPDKRGVISDEPADQPVAIIMLNTRCNSPLGLLAPGFKESGDRFDAMMKELDEDYADKFDYLGGSSWISADRTCGNELYTILYFRSLRGLQDFANSPLHREGMEWWNKIYKQYPHLSIGHEIYDVPRKHWENMYQNNHHPSGLAGTTFRRKISKEDEAGNVWAFPIVDATRSSLRTMMRRMGRETGDD